MKFFIASDIHGSAKYCRMMLEAFEREGADRLLLLGDILYHGPRNPLPEEYSPADVAQMLTSVCQKIICVRGNCDSEVDQMVLPFPALAENAAVFADGVDLYLAHGHKDVPPLPKGSVFITGHTHVPLKMSVGDFYHLNPGSVSLPKNGSPHGYILYNNRKFVFKTLEGEQYDCLDLSNAEGVAVKRQVVRRKVVRRMPKQ